MDNPKIEIEKVTIPDVKKPAGEDELTASELNQVSGGGYAYGTNDKSNGA